MLALLGFLLDGIELIGTYCLWAAEEAVDGLLAALVVAWNFVLGALPGMGNIATIGTPTWLAWLNWFFPVGAFLALLTAGVAMWAAYLAVRFVLRLLHQ